MRLLERLAVSRMQARIQQHLVEDKGMSETQAAATVHTIGSGLGSILQWVITNAPTIYADIAFVAAFFGVVLPPLPPMPLTPAA